MNVSVNVDVGGSPMPGYTEIIPKAAPGAPERAVDEWNRLAAGLVDSEGLDRSQALEKALRARPDLVARVQADPQPMYSDPPVAKAAPLGPAGQQLERLARQLRDADRTLSGPQSLAKAAHVDPELAGRAIDEDLAR